MKCIQKTGSLKNKKGQAYRLKQIFLVLVSNIKCDREQMDILWIEQPTLGVQLQCGFWNFCEELKSSNKTL